MNIRERYFLLTTNLRVWRINNPVHPVIRCYIRQNSTATSSRPLQKSWAFDPISVYLWSLVTSHFWLIHPSVSTKLPLRDRSRLKASSRGSARGVGTERLRVDAVVLRQQSPVGLKISVEQAQCTNHNCSIIGFWITNNGSCAWSL